MMKLFQRICAGVLIVIGTTALCDARTAYVSDMLILTFRQGPGPNYPVISALKSDTPLTVIEESNGYLKVALSSGEQGWVDKNYIVTDPPKSIVIDQLKNEKAALEDKVQELTAQIEAQSQAVETQPEQAEGDATSGTAVAVDQSAMEALKQENQALTQDIDSLKTQYTALKTASADIAATLEENKRLKARNASLTASLDQKKTNDGFLFKTGMIKWFLAGVACCSLAGLLA